MNNTKTTIHTLLEKKQTKEKITMITCYDYPTALIINKSPIDAVLVGDSLGMVMLGYPNTIPVTLNELIHHTKAVSRAITRPLLIADMPMGTYHISESLALKNVIRVVKQSRAEAVKIEGGANRAKLLARIVEAEIPVMGHIGLTPQSIYKMGGYKVQGKDMKKAEELIADAHALQDAGAFAIVLECIPYLLAQRISDGLTIPTIGIGSGVHCDGQILVLHDMLGVWESNTHKFVKCYAHLYEEIANALSLYCGEVKQLSFPTKEHSFNDH